MTGKRHVKATGVAGRLGAGANRGAISQAQIVGTHRHVAGVAGPRYCAAVDRGPLWLVIADQCDVRCIDLDRAGVAAVVGSRKDLRVTR